MLMHAIAHRDCTDTVRDFALKVDPVVVIFVVVVVVVVT